MKRKVLIIGPNFWEYNQSVERAFIKLGFKCEVIGFNETLGLSSKIHYAFSPFKAKSEKYKYYINNLILEKYNEFKPDIFFVIKGTILFEETLDKINNAIKVLWMMDSIFRFKQIYNLKKYFDFLFMFEKTDVDKLKKVDSVSYFLPMALDENVYYPIPELRKDVDIFFVGSLYDARLDILYRIIEDFKNKNLKFFGRRIFTKNKPYKYFLNRSVFPNKTLPPSEVNQYYNRSKICINIHKLQSKHSPNPRFFEIIGAKALQIADKIPFIIENFEEDEVLTFTNYDELKELIQENMHLSNNLIVDKAFKKIINNHTFLHRVKFIIHKIQANNNWLFIDNI